METKANAKPEPIKILKAQACRKLVECANPQAPIAHTIPPIDNTLFFGNCLFVNKDEDDSIISVTLCEWEKIYEELFGGFEDLGDEDSDDSEEEDEDEKLPKTKSGYAKDGFVVDDDEDMDESEDEDFTESEEEKPKKRKYTARKKTTKKENTIKIAVPTSVFDVGSDIDLDFVDELQEEEYV